MCDEFFNLLDATEMALFVGMWQAFVKIAQAVSSRPVSTIPSFVLLILNIQRRKRLLFL